MAARSADEMDLLRVKSDTLQHPAHGADWSRKKLVWVPSDKDGFALASIVNGDPHVDPTIHVELLDSGERMQVSSDEIQKPNPPKYEKCEDMAMLTCLNEASVLHTLRQRYFSNLYYTYSGLFCVVINPYRRIGIYTDTLAEQFKCKKRKEMPPHIFAVADEAYRSMLQDRDDQSILCTGESGAGKTENTKKVIQYLAYVAGNRSLKNGTQKTSVDLDTSQNRIMGQLEEQLLQANPVLEAFGNSKTIKNDNSSRFGKFIRIHFDASGCISGANIEFYLLEKSRVLKQAKNERAFHIFYQLLHGLSSSQKEQYLIEENPSKYRFLTNGDCKLAGVDDAHEFGETMQAMGVMGLSDEEIGGIFKVVSAVLLLGNLDFSPENKNSDQAVLLNDSTAQKIATLLGVNANELMKAFLKPRIKVQRDLVHRAQNVEQARFSVGAIAKASYERLFRWLVHRLNKSLDRTRQHSVSFIGILDIAGFEIFDANSFEQLCINYTNEKLQQLFNNTMFVREQQEYVDEGIEWKFMDFGLNLQPTIDLIEKPMGILSTLDDVCLFPQGSDQSLVQRLSDTYSQHSKYVIPEIRSRSDFAIVHYAGRVDYQAEGWRVKNMDPLNENVIEVLNSSREAIVSEMWRDVADVCSLSATTEPTLFGNRVPKKGMFRTVSQLYKEQLGRLMSTLANTNPHFVRCIIPNHEKKHGVINSQLVLDQLRCNGVLEGIRICRQGFPTRIAFQEFRQRYERLLAPNVNPRGYLDGKEAVRRLVNALEIDENLYRIGQSKVFFRVGTIAQLEEMRDEKVTALVEALQAHCRGWLARRRLLRRKERESAVRIVQRNGLAWLRLREWKWWWLLMRVRPLVEVTNKDEVIAEKENELKVTTEKLRRSEVFIADYRHQIGKLDEERAILKERLDAESNERAEIYEERSRIAAMKNELEKRIEYLGKQLDAEEKHGKMVENENKRLTETVGHLEETLEEEERARQKLLIERNELEKRLKALQAEGVEIGETGVRLAKEKRLLEERCEDLVSQLIDEQERAKQLVKAKIRGEAMVEEIREELEKEKAQRQSAETARRAAESQLREEQDACVEKTRRADELSNQLMRKDAELAQINVRVDEELSIREKLEKEVRELKTRLEDEIEETGKERAARQKAEKAKRDMGDELEAYKHELEESNDKSALNSQMRAKRDEEYLQLQKQLEETRKGSENAMEEMRATHLKKLEEVQELVDQLKRQKATAEKATFSAETDKENARAELANVLTARQEAEKKRKTVEGQLAEKENKMREMQTGMDELTAKLVKLNSELESAQKAKESEVTRNSNLLKKIASLDMQLAELTDVSEEERKSRANLNNRVRQLEEELAVAIEAKEEALLAHEKSEKEVGSLKSQLVEARKKLDEENREMHEEMRRRMERELVIEKEKVEAAEQGIEKAERAKRNALQEAEDALKELADSQVTIREMERKQRRFDQQLNDERNATEKATMERDCAQQATREIETKTLQMTNEVRELKEIIEQLEREKRTLRLEVDDLASTKDDVGKSVFELEKTKRRLEEELSKAEGQIIDLEDGIQMAEDAKSRLEVTLQATKADFERQMASRDEEEEEKRKHLLSQNHSLSEELEGERRARTMAVAAKKKLEMQIADVGGQLDAAQRQIDDMARQMRKMQNAFKEVQFEATEARTAMDDALNAQRDAEKRARNAEEEIKRLNEEVNTLGSSRRRLEAERDELLDELANSNKSVIGIEEKRRLETRIVDLEEQLEEESTAHDVAQEKSKKAQQQLEQVIADLAMERSLCERNETEKAHLERQNRELREQLENAESHTSTRIRTQLSVAEAKIANLEQQIATEDQEKLRQVRALRRMESKLAEATKLLEEEKRDGEQQRAATDRLNQRIRQLRVQLEDADAEKERLAGKLKEERRRADELTDKNETLARDVTILKQRDTTSRGTPIFGRESRRFGSGSSLAKELPCSDDYRSFGQADRPSSRLTSGTGSQLGGDNTDDDRDSIRN